VRRSRKAAIRLVLDAWRGRGWRDEAGAALAVIERLAALGGYDDTVADALPRAFLDRNGISFNEGAGELRRVLSHVQIDEGSTIDEEPKRLKIVFFAANPRDQVQLDLAQEAREVEERLRKTQHRDVIDFVTKWAVRPADLIEALNRERPQIIHFSGHGSDTDELLFQDDFGRTKAVPKGALAATIKTVSDEVRLILFNNCFSEEHAKEAVKHIEVSVGMTDSISDDAARMFAANFYASLGYGRSVNTAFDQARAALMLEGIPEDETPHLFARRDVDAASLVLVASD
jgi:hypothetical protein